MRKVHLNTEDVLSTLYLNGGFVTGAVIEAEGGRYFGMILCESDSHPAYSNGEMLDCTLCESRQAAWTYITNYTSN